MTDLTRITGIGPATARALAGAGIDTVAALAAADAAALAVHPGFRGLRASHGDLANWVSQARQIAGGPPALMIEDTEGGEDSAGADPADSAEPPIAAGDMAPVPGQTGAGTADADPPPAPDPETPDPARIDLAGFELVVRGPKRGRWRAGRLFGANPTRIAGHDLSPDALAALRDDPALSVEVVPVTG